jgi:hypothetical protein
MSNISCTQFYVWFNAFNEVSFADIQEISTELVEEVPSSNM